jgi:hypothetical protein
MPRLKAGARMRSAVCDTEIMVIAGPDEEVSLECGGTPMLDAKADRPSAGSPAPDHSAGTAMGKRYVDEAGTVELLCVKPGSGSLSLVGVALKPKDAKPLPSSD